MLAGTVSELPFEVVAPAEQLVSTGGAAGMSTECTYRSEAMTARDSGRAGSICCRAITQLSVAVAAPAYGRMIACDAAGVHATRRDGRKSIAVDGDRSGVAKGCPVTKLAESVLAPAIRSSRRGESTRMRAPAGERDEADACLHRGRHGAVSRGSVTKLAGIVGTPAVRSAGFIQRASVVPSCSEVGKVDPTGDQDRGRAVNGTSIAKLAMCIGAPAENVSIGGQCTTVLRAGLDGDKGVASRDVCRSSAFDGGTVAHLPVIVATPAVRSPICRERTRV